MGWIALLILAGAALALCWRLGVARPLWSLVGAALMLGATGYALQGSPTLRARPAVPPRVEGAADAGLIQLRDDMLGRYTADGAYLIAADAMARIGERRAAVQVLLAGLRKIPRSLDLWLGLGNALVEHDGALVSPSALFAFQQAARIAPRHPAPPFFLGVAYVRAGEFDKAQLLWRRAVALAPPSRSYRREIAVRLVLLNRYLALRDAG